MYYSSLGMIEHINHVTENLFIGDIHARDPELLSYHSIKHVISILTEGEHFFDTRRAPRYPDGTEVKEKKFNLDDDDNADILAILPEIIKIFEAATALQENVLIHCQAGVSRSAAVVIGIIISKPELLGAYTVTFKAALKYLRSVRGIVEPNRKFEEDLTKLERVFASWRKRGVK
jgi:predicted protein tyrosine phosphatase